MERLRIVLLSVLLILFCGCGRQKENEAFNIETDWQYQMIDPVVLTDKMTEDSQGVVYFVNGYFLYKHDKKTGETLPLCSRPNCLHDQETDPEKLINCHAFFDFWGARDGGSYHIYYEKGSIYLAYLSVSATRTDASGTTLGTRLVRIGIDGGSRETVRIIDHQPLTVRLHRGRCYYVVNWFEEDGTEHKDVRVFPLARPSEDKLMMEIPEDMGENGVIYLLYPYGNNVYIWVTGYSNELEDHVYRIYRYGAETGKMEKMPLPVQKENQQLWDLTLFQNKLHGFIMEDDGVESGVWSGLYAMEMDGSSSHEVIDLPAPKVFSDGKYLYVSNAPQVVEISPDADNEGKTAQLWVYDKDYHLVDAFTEDVYNSWHFDFMMGVGEYGYRILRDEENEFYGCLQLFDKSQIGTMNGKKAVFTTVAEMTGSPADQSYRDFMENGYRGDFFDGSFFEI